MSELEDVLADSAEELFEDAPCGYLTTALDGRIVKVNRTFETWTGLTRADLIGTRFMDLLSPGGRIFYETHLLPLLLMQGWIREIAVELRGAGGRTLPALVNAVLRRDGAGEPRAIRVTIFDATDRRRYEEELLRARNREHEIARRLQESLLEGALTDDARLPTGIAYVPSARGLQVGGDWYDAFEVAEDRIALVVGDVAGPQQGGQRGGEAQPPGSVGQVQRLDAEAVAREHEPAAVALGDGEGEHALEALHAALAPVAVALQHDLGVAVGEEAQARGLELGAQLAVVVDAAVEDDRQAQHGVDHRLRAAL